MTIRNFGNKISALDLGASVYSDFSPKFWPEAGSV